MNPKAYAKSGSEYSHQVALFMWVSMSLIKYPALRWYHSIQNEENSGSKIRGGRSKASGTKAGVHDTFLPAPRGQFAGLYIEMKKPDGKPSDKQLEFGLAVQEEHYAWAVCDHWEKARDTLIEYLECRFIQKTYKGVKHRKKLVDKK